jgi:hypothetical protein
VGRLDHRPLERGEAWQRCLRAGDIDPFAAAAPQVLDRSKVEEIVSEERSVRQQCDQLGRSLASARPWRGIQSSRSILRGVNVWAAVRKPHFTSSGDYVMQRASKLGISHSEYVERVILEAEKWEHLRELWEHLRELMLHPNSGRGRYPKSR